MSLYERIRRALIMTAVLLEQMRTELRLGETHLDRARALREKQERARKERLEQAEKELREGRAWGNTYEVQA